MYLPTDIESHWLGQLTWPVSFHVWSMNDEVNSDWVIGPGKCVTIVGLPVQEIVVSFDCSKGKEDFKSSLASKTVLPRRSGGQYHRASNNIFGGEGTPARCITLNY
jgi:hypothetical protein